LAGIRLEAYVLEHSDEDPEHFAVIQRRPRS
jgi:hypothetical protein